MKPYKDNINFIFTYKSEFGNDTKNNEQCLVDILCLIIAANKIKLNYSNHKIILYTDENLVDFFQSFDLFSIIRIMPNLEIIENQNPGKFNKKTLYKLFVIEKQNEPFIHLDNDLFINNKNFLKNINKKIFFSYEEFIKPSNEFYYNLYFETLTKVANKIGENVDEIKNFINVESAANCSIIADLNGFTLKESFSETIAFYKKYANILNKEENIQMFLEQYYQLNCLINLIEKKNISFVENLVKGVWEFENFKEVQLPYSDQNYNKLSKSIKNFLEGNTHIKSKNEKFKSNDVLINKVVHASGSKQNLYFKKAFSEILKTISMDSYTKMKNYFVHYEWF